MKWLGGAGIVTAVLWWLSNTLSSDAIGMLVGGVFMFLAMVPVCVLIYATGKRRDEQQKEQRESAQSAPVVIVLGGNGGYQGWGRNTLSIPQGYDTPRQQERIIDLYAGNGWEER